MPWGRIDDKLHSHRKVRAMSRGLTRLSAMGLWALGISYTNDHGTDGTIDHATVVDITGSKKLADRLASALVTSGLWVVTESGWRYHDWHVYNFLAIEAEANRAELSAKRAEAGRVGGLKSAERRAKQLLEAKPSKTEQTQAPVPSPSPDPDQKRSRLGPTGPGPSVEVVEHGGEHCEDLATLEWQPAPAHLPAKAATPVQAVPPKSPTPNGHAAPSPPQPVASIGLPGVSIATTTPTPDKVPAAQRYAVAYARGIEAASTGRFPPIRRGDEDRAMRDVLTVFAVHADKTPIRGDALLDWITAAARAYRLARPNADFEQGWSHRKFLEWHRKGCPVEARAVAPRVPIQTPTGASRAWRTHEEKTGERHENDRRTGGGIDEEPRDGAPVRAVR